MLSNRCVIVSGKHLGSIPANKDYTVKKQLLPLLNFFSNFTFLLQIISSQYVKKRSFDPVIASSASFAPYPSHLTLTDCDMVPYPDPYYTVPAIYIPEQAYVSEYAGPVCDRACVGCSDYLITGPFGSGFGNYAVQSGVTEETVIDTSATSPSPLIKAVGFGGDALALALSPLLEAADADVALLMFTKVKSC